MQLGSKELGCPWGCLTPRPRQGPPPPRTRTSAKAGEGLVLLGYPLSFPGLPAQLPRAEPAGIQAEGAGKVKEGAQSWCSCITPALGRECRSLSSWWLEPLLLGGSVPQTLLVPKPSTWAGGPSHHSCAFLVWLGGPLAVRQRDFAVWDKEAALRVRGPLSPPAPPAVFPALH